MSNPKISGFTIIRNGIQFDYPFKESILSILPVVDEFVINVGKSDDDTLSQIQELVKLHPEKKFIIFESDWQLDHPEKKKGGLILSEQTNLALMRCSYDWCFYIQGDEVIHDQDIPAIKESLLKHSHRAEVEGFLFDYVHFYGSYNVIQHSRSAYRREVRIIRKSSGAQSVGDAQSFRKKDGEKLKVIRSHARIFHYGWVRKPEAMKEKTFFLDQLYHGPPSDQEALQQTPYTKDNYKYKRFWGLIPYAGTHPKIMKKRIESQGWNWDLKNSPFLFSKHDIKKIVLDLFERLTGYRLFEYRSYKLIR